MTHYVVVNGEVEAEAYIAKGYARSVAGHLGSLAWALLLPEQRRPLVLVEVDEAAHAALNRPPRAYLLASATEYYWVSASPLPVDVLEQGEFDSIVARADADEGPSGVSNHDLHPTARECVSAARGQILLQITRHERAVSRLTELLREHDCL